MNSSERIAVERYAKAYDSLSSSAQEARARAGELTRAAAVLKAAAAFMASPQVPAAQKQALVAEALPDAPQAARLAAVLLRARRYHLLTAVAARAEELADEREGIKRAVVWSARELSAKQQAETKQALSARYGGQAEAVFKTDPALLGGLKIFCEGELIDGSLQGKLVKLEREISR